jgi:hypothetical protein
MHGAGSLPFSEDGINMTVQFIDRTEGRKDVLKEYVWHAEYGI